MKKNTIPNLPCNKFQKFAGAFQSQNRPGRRKKSATQNQAISTGDHQTESDSIHNSEEMQPLLPPGNAAAFEDFQLEVVLTGHATTVANVETEIAVQPAYHEGSGLATLLGPMEEVVHISRDSGVEVPIRQHVEAKKILEIQKEVGVTTQETEEEHLKRIVAMEVRDKSEKDGREMNRVTAVSQ
jgi:hypothetical protein